MTYDDELDAVSRAMQESPEHKVGAAIQGVFAALDELIVLANREETRALVCNEKIALGQVLTRCETLCSFALAVKPAPLMVRRVS
jgi:hypothetical protein